MRLCSVRQAPGFSRRVRYRERGLCSNPGFAQLHISFFFFFTLFILHLFSSAGTETWVPPPCRGPADSLVLWLKRAPSFLETPLSDLAAQTNFVSLPAKNCCEMIR